MRTWDYPVEKDNEELLNEFLNQKDSNEQEIIEYMTFNELESKIQSWAKDKGLHHKNAKTQVLKTCEEIGELARAANTHDIDGIVDAIGDTTVTLIVLCLQYDLNITVCLESAWDEIKDRKGKTIDGNFIKE